MLTTARMGALLNSALYLATVFTAGIATGSYLAWHLAVATAGICFVGYVVQAEAECLPARSLRDCLTLAAAGLSILSIVTGLAAGVALL